MISDKGFILDPNQWPSWPFLPLKRSTDHWPETGFMMEGKFTIYVLNMFSLSSMNEVEFANCKKYEYPNVDALLADRWIVD
jgi:hypothetical protein